MKVFLVEDSELLRDRLVRAFSIIKGVEVCGFSDSAEQAIRQIQQTQADVIILDIRLRQGNGFQVLQSVKKPGQPPTVIVLTNFAYPQYRKKFLAAGADYFFDKSDEFTQVTVVLRELLTRNGATAKPRRKKISR
ncbi:MAG: response regulator transcription factor [Chloroflexi bacterium]|nr:response regulator transcription factor [Chloroflexota bacterium]